MSSFIKKNLFLILILCMVVFSILVPKPGIFIKDIGVLPVLTFLAMFLSGLSLSLDSLADSFRNYKLIVFSALVAFIVFPVVAYLLASLFFAQTYDAFVGAIIISTQASTVTSAIVLTMAARGNISLAIVITVVNNLLSAFVSPPLLRLFLSLDRPIEFNVPGMILNLVLVLIVPIILAQLCNRYLKKAVALLNKRRKLAANAIVLLFVSIGASTAASEVVKNVQVVLLIVLFALVLHVVILLVCYAYARLVKTRQENLAPLLFCSSEKTMTTSTMIWGTYFPQYLIAPIVIVTYHLIQIVVDSILAGSMSRKAEAQAERVRKETVRA